MLYAFIFYIFYYFFMKSFFLALLWAIIGSSSVVLASTIFPIQNLLNNPWNQNNKNINDPFLEYYVTENAVAVSPHDLRMEMDKWGDDFIIVDLRSAWEYQAEHIRWAINIPGIAGDANAQAQEDRIIREFAKLPKDKRIIIHCYTHYCMLAKHVGLMLAKKWIYVHELNIGWNEWRYQWDLWNGEGTSKTVNVLDYIEWTAVKNSGTWKINNKSGVLLDFMPCTADGLAGC